MSNRPRKALIIGAGIAGPVTAILLRRAGIESAIYEAWPYSKGIGGDQPIIAYFADGTTAEGDFLIGADGVHSVVRRQVIPDGPVPFNTGLIGFGGFVPHAVLGGRPIDGHVETTFGQSGFFGYGYCS